MMTIEEIRRPEEEVSILTEEIRAQLANLGDIIEDIHYDPKNATRDDIENMEALKELIKTAKKIAKQTARHCGERGGRNR